jgi:FkbM family methyltransferase
LTDPRLLLLDFTEIKGPAATSTLKAAYFNDWREDALLHVMDIGHGRLGAAAGCGVRQDIFSNEDHAQRLVAAFKPQLVLYRPVADSPALDKFAAAAIDAARARGAGLALWMMDDWPARIETANLIQFQALDKNLRELFSKSALNFAISDGMAEAFGRRYGVKFEVAHNGIDPSAWPLRSKHPQSDIVVKYAGSLAPDTTKDSVADVAKAISRLAQQGLPVRLEGRTQSTWMNETGKTLNALDAVTFDASDLDETAYRQWLAEADILLVAYNFDAATRTYLKYSFANKLPETMAAGAAILAYGPGDLETLNYLHRSQTALMVTNQHPEELEAAIATLVKDQTKRATLAAAARNHAFTHFDLKRMKARFRKSLSSVAAAPLGAFEAAQTDKVQLDECRFVFEILNASEHCGVMVDVGAHVGGSLMPYARAGWRVFAFEPDDKNRKALLTAASGMENIIIDERAVGAEAATGLAFYRSEISTGISGLTPFHDSHEKAGSVDVTTLNALIAKQKLAVIDFLKIDVEGHEMAVLDGIDFNQIKPRAIVAEFEDAKTLAHGYTVKDLAERFITAGYTVFVSEWRPIEAYGKKHAWRRLQPYPCDIAEGAWGNLVALLEPPTVGAVAAALDAALSGGPAGMGARGAIGEIACPPPLYYRIAVVINERAPGVAAILRPIARALRAMLQKRR